MIRISFINYSFVYFQTWPISMSSYSRSQLLIDASNDIQRLFGTKVGLYCGCPVAMSSSSSCVCHQITIHMANAQCIGVQLNKVTYPFSVVVDGTTSTGDVACCMFGTTSATGDAVALGQSPAQHYVGTKYTNSSLYSV